MSGWLARAATDVALRGEEPRNRFARWTARWFTPTPVVPESRFQDADEPFPGHWRRFPDRWPASPSIDADVRGALVAAIDELPVTWRDVLVARDVLGRDPAEVERLVGLTPRQQRAILHRARARLRDRLDRRLARDGGG
jgi:RNA polymerase sigma-70 factor (ECF subfamily)